MDRIEDKRIGILAADGFEQSELMVPSRGWKRRVDQGVITSRNPGDLEAFCKKLIEEVNEDLHEERAVA